LGKYTVEIDKNGQVVRRGRILDKFFESVEDAQTSCEDDYQRRILSAITLRSAADVEVEADLEKATRVLRFVSNLQIDNTRDAIVAKSMARCFIAEQEGEVTPLESTLAELESDK
jgi:hypothetical protein